MKKIKNLILYIILSTIGFSASKIYFQNGIPTYYYNNDNTYEDIKIVNDIKSSAVETYPDGRIFKYNYVNGVKQGKGIIEYPDKSIEELQISDGILYGKAKRTYADGSVDFFEYKFNKIHGDYYKKYKNLKILNKYYYGQLYYTEFSDESSSIIERKNHYANKKYFINSNKTDEIIEIPINYLDNIFINITKNKNTKNTTVFLNDKKLIIKNNRYKNKNFIIKLEKGNLKYVKLYLGKKTVELFFENNKMYKSITTFNDKKAVELYDDGLLDGKSEIIYNNGSTVSAYFEKGRLKENSEIKINENIFKVRSDGLFEFPYNAYLKDTDEKFIGYIPVYTILESEIRQPLYTYALTKKGEYITYPGLNYYDKQGEFIQVDEIK